MISVQTTPDLVVASLDKALYDNYLCLEASKKKQIQWARIRSNLLKYRITGKSYKQVRINSYRNENCADHPKVSV